MEEGLKKKVCISQDGRWKSFSPEGEMVILRDMLGGASRDLLRGDIHTRSHLKSMQSPKIDR